MTCHPIRLGPGTVHLQTASGETVTAKHDGFEVQVVRTPGVDTIRDPRRPHSYIYEYTWHSVSCVCRRCLSVDMSARHLSSCDAVVFLQPDD